MVSLLQDKKIYLDANALIYSVEYPESYPGLVEAFLKPLAAGKLKAVTSCITLVEVLCKPMSSGDSVLEAVYRAFLTPSDVMEVCAVETEIAERATRIRAAHGFRTPDAIHIATGIRYECDLFLSRDKAWSRAGVQLVSPDQL
jgi:predicted nucleic acid-binding protein